MSTRRTFVKGSLGLLSGAVAGLSLSRSASAKPQTTTPVENKETAEKLSEKSTWSDVRNQFLLDPGYIHLAGLLLSSHPLPVRNKIDQYRQMLDANPPLGLFMSEGDKPTLDAAENYLGARKDEIALVNSTTMGLGLMYGGLTLNADDHILTTDHDHYSTYESLRFAAARSMATVERVSLYTKGSEANFKTIVNSLLGKINAKTRIVAITWVHSSTGVKLPISDIASKIKTLNKSRSKPILLFVDGVHGFGIENINVNDLGCDVFIAGCHKWLFGPRGTGLVWANSRGWEAVEPVIPSFDRDTYRQWQSGGDPSSTPKAARMTPGGFHNFESRWALAEAFKMHLDIGKARIAARTHELNSYTKDKLRALKHVTLHTPAASDLSSGIVTFEVAGKSANDVMQHLAKNKVISSTTPYQVSYARITPSVFNSESEVDDTVKHLSDIKWIKDV